MQNPVIRHRRDVCLFVRHTLALRQNDASKDYETLHSPMAQLTLVLAIYGSSKNSKALPLSVKWEWGRKIHIFSTKSRLALSQKRCKVRLRLPLITNRKLLSIGAKINDLEWPWTTIKDSFSIPEMHHYSTCNIPLQDDNKCFFKTGQQGSQLYQQLP